MPSTTATWRCRPASSGPGRRIRWRQPVGAAAAVQSRALHLLGAAVRIPLRPRHRRGDRRRPGARPGRRRARGCVPDRVGCLLSGLRRRPRAAVVPCSAVQHLDRNALPANPSRCAGLRAGAAGRRVAAGRADDRRPVVARLRHLDIRPGHLPGPGRHGPRAARAGLFGDALAGAVRQPGHRDLPLAAGGRVTWSGPADGAPAIRHWWNGYSAVLDATNPEAVAWLHAELDALVDEFGIDGFKFDGGDLWSYRADDVVAGSADPTGQCEAWARLGRKYPFNEYRACWKMGGQPLAQRLHDKPPTWGAGGLASLDPRFHRAGPDRPCLCLSRHGRRRRARRLLRGQPGRGTVRPVRTVRRVVPDDAVLRVAGPGARRGAAERGGRGRRGASAACPGHSSVGQTGGPDGRTDPAALGIPPPGL